MVYSPGQMEEGTKVIGTMANNMEKVSIIHLKVKLKEENGKKAKESDGWEKINDNRI